MTACAYRVRVAPCRESSGWLQSVPVLRVISTIAFVFVLASVVTPVHADAGYQTKLVRVSAEPPYRTQLDDSIYAVSDCGPAVLGMVLDDYGIDESTLRLRQLTHTYQGTLAGSSRRYRAAVRRAGGGRFRPVVIRSLRRRYYWGIPPMDHR